MVRNLWKSWEFHFGLSKLGTAWEYALDAVNYLHMRENVSILSFYTFDYNCDMCNLNDAEIFMADHKQVSKIGW